MTLNVILLFFTGLAAVLQELARLVKVVRDRGKVIEKLKEEIELLNLVSAASIILITVIIICSNV